MRVWRLDDCDWHPQRAAELTPFPVPARIAEAVALAWLRVFPQDNVWTT